MREARAQTACVAGLCIALAGCAGAPAINAPLPGGAAVSTGYYLHADADRHSSPSLLVVLAFSGGGTRAAAFAYGVLKKLAVTTITWDGRERRLLDEVDLISSVSGGSFTAAYYGLFGERLFRDFEARFLKRDVEGELLRRLLSPWHWPRLWYSSRTDLAAEYYDEILFEGKTVGDIKRRGAAFITLNATDIGLGTQFGFDQRQFDRLCSDVTSVSVARAVAASSAVPILFEPVTLENYAGRCAEALPDWAGQALAEADAASRNFHLARKARAYRDSNQLRYVHLADGGLSDNLGVRPVLDLISISGGAWQALQALGRAQTHRFVLIVVNAQNEEAHDIGRYASVPLSHTLSSVTSVPLNSYSFETLSLIRSLMQRWDEEITVGRCWELAKQGLDQTGCYDIDHFLVEVSFDQDRDEPRRERLQRLPTSLSLPGTAVDELRAAAAEILDQSESFQALRRDQVPAVR